MVVQIRFPKTLIATPNQRKLVLMRLQTLGGLKLEASDFQRPKPLLLLAYLAVEGAKDRRHLAEFFWSDASEPATSLRVALGQLRKGATQALNDDGQRVSLTLESDVAKLIEAIREQQFERVPALYTGSFLEGFLLPDWSAELEEWVYATREFLAAQVRNVLLRVAESQALQGKFAEAAQTAEQAYKVRGANPLEVDDLERLLALLLVGDSVLVGEVLREARELGLEPTITAPQARAKYAAQVKDSPRVATLPTARTSFIGRDPELVEIGGLLERGEARLLTLLGPGGIGKTRLALQVAHDQVQENRFQDGVYMIALENLTNPQQIPRALADALGVSIQGNTDPLEAVVGFIGTGRVLIVLDNFEQLIEGAELVSNLLERCPNLTVLVTSRELLHLEEEFALPVAGLPIPKHGSSLENAESNDAVRLFVQRAKRARIDFALEQIDVPFVLEICELLDGSPLGIELAAAWVKVLPISEIALEIKHNLDILETPVRNTKEGHRSLRAVFERSWALLTPREADVFARLAVFQGGFSREAASEVAGATISVLASLVDKSLLRVNQTGRYDRHALLHQYTLEKLELKPDEFEQARMRHLEFFKSLSLRADPLLLGPEQALWFERLEQELPNFRAALNWTIEQRQGEDFVSCTRALRFLWVYRGYVSEGRAWLTRGIKEANIPKDGTFYAETIANLALVVSQQGDLVGADALYLENLAIYRTLNRKPNIAATLTNLAINARQQGRIETALAYGTESLELMRELGKPNGIALSLSNLASIELDLEQYAKARLSTEESLKIQRELGNTVFVANTLLNLGGIIGLQGDFLEARARLEEALVLYRNLGNAAGTATAQLNLGDIAQQQSDLVTAQAYYQASLPVLHDLNDLYVIPFGLEGLAGVFATTDFTRAAQLWGAAHALRERIGSPMPPYAQHTFETQVLSARRNFGEEPFNAAWAQGQTMPLDQVIALALEPHPQISSEVLEVRSQIV